MPSADTIAATFSALISVILTMLACLKVVPVKAVLAVELLGAVLVGLHTGVAHCAAAHQRAIGALLGPP